MNLTIHIEKEGLDIKVNVPVDCNLDDIRKCVAKHKGGIDYSQIRFVLKEDIIDNDAKVSEFGIKDGDIIDTMVSTVLLLESYRWLMRKRV